MEIPNGEKYEIQHFEDCENSLKIEVCGELMLSFMDDFLEHEIYSVNDCIEFMGFHFTTGNNCLFVLTQEQKFVGSISIHFQEPFGYTPNIGNLYIVPSHRGKQLAKDLIEFACEYIRRNEQSLSNVFLWCENKLVDLYIGYGWEKIDMVNRKNIMKKRICL